MLYRDANIKLFVRKHDPCHLDVLVSLMLHYLEQNDVKLAFMGIPVCMLHFTSISSLSKSCALHDMVFLFFTLHSLSLSALALSLFKVYVKAWK